MSFQKIIIVTGLPCVGKSTLAKKISKNLSLPIFSVDPIESAILESHVTTKRNFETGLAAYLVTKTLAGEQLKQGLSVIIDAVSPVQESRDMWQSLSVLYSAKLIIIECQLDKKLHKFRVEGRIRSIKNIPEVTWEYVLKIQQGYLKWDQERLNIDTANNCDDNLKKAIDYINKKI